MFKVAGKTDKPPATNRSDGVEVVGDGPECNAASSKWARPPLPIIDSTKDNIAFQQIDLDHYIGTHVVNMPGATVGPTPIIRMYGITMEGNSVMAHIYGFTPYFYIPAQIGFQKEDCGIFKDTLNAAVLKDLRSNKEPIEHAVLAVDYVMRESIYGYHENRKIPFLQITVAIPSLIARCKGLLNGRFKCPGYEETAFETYESNINFEIRFMVDANVVGCNWIELPAGCYSIRQASSSSSASEMHIASRCQLEVDIAWTKFISHPIDGEWSKVAPFRILSFHVECAGRRGDFPDDNSKDHVIQIANMVIEQGDPDPFIRNVFTLESCAPVVGSEVSSYETEHELLYNWASFFRDVDPDIVTGYNFDFPYLIKRASHLKVEEFAYLGRIKNILRKQKGKRKNNIINMEGRFQFDLLQVLRNDYNLKSYSLTAVSLHFLQEQKEHMQSSIVTDLQNGNELTRRRLAIYCLKGAILPLRLLEKLMSVISYMEMARVTGVPLPYLLTKGQQIRIMSQLLRKAKEQELLMPEKKVKKIKKGPGYEGATIFEPDKGYHDIPIATLDFASLYPSIMIAHNLCYTTLLTEAASNRLSADQFIKTPTGNYFCKATVRKGLLPGILETLLEARRKAKSELENETDPFKRKVLDGRQLALKISANSVYGFTGAQLGMLPCLEISASVTAFGRSMMEITKQYVEETYTRANGYEHDAKVIYGDTDSVMCKFGVATVEEAITLGKDAAEKISTKFNQPIRLEFEKVYFPYLLINIKRYAGLYWTNPTKYDKMDCKGIETVKRDTPPLVAHVINTCLTLLLIDRNQGKAIEYAKQSISDLMCDRIDISQLIITKELTTNQSKRKYAHATLAERMQERDPDSAPKIGDRVPYVIVGGLNRDAANLRSEDPVCVLENNIPIDTQYYLEKQLSQPLMRIFKPVLGENTQSILLEGAHMNTKKVGRQKDGSLSTFTKKMSKCIGCKVLFDNEDQALCQKCKPKCSELYLREISQVQDLEEKLSCLWTQCQRCQESLHKDILCTNRECLVFYKRKKVQRDLSDQDKTVARFVNVSW